MRNEKLIVIYKGEAKALRELCKEHGRKFHTVYHRVRRGYPEELWLVDHAPHNTPTGPRHGKFKHGCSNHNSRAYDIYHGMLQRCTNPKVASYKRYGGRGIRVCDEWSGSEGFSRFLADMGEPPTRTSTIERNDNNLGYSRANCCWLEGKLQPKNRRSNIMLTYKGITDTVNSWAGRIGISPETLRMRVKKGWPIEQCLSPYRRRNQFDMEWKILG